MASHEQDYCTNAPAIDEAAATNQRIHRYLHASDDDRLRHKHCAASQIVFETPDVGAATVMNERVRVGIRVRVSMCECVGLDVRAPQKNTYIY